MSQDQVDRGQAGVGGDEATLVGEGPKDKEQEGLPGASGPDPNYEFDGETYLYTGGDGIKHRWNLKTNTWEVHDGDQNVVSVPTPVPDEKDEAEEDTEDEDDDDDDEGVPKAKKPKKGHDKRNAAPGWGGKGAEYSVDPDTGVHLYRDPTDGTMYEWDARKSAWFPRIDEDFLAQYQMNYGFNNEGMSEPTKPSEPDREAAESGDVGAAKGGRGGKGPGSKSHWFDEEPDKSAKVYVSGLPVADGDFDEEKFVQVMSKCGVVEADVRTNKPKVKLYRDSNGMLKGDGLCTYVKPESVELALTILDGYRMEVGPAAGDGRRPTTVLKVERAKFEMKGDRYDPKLKPKKLGKKELERQKKNREKALSWEMDRLRGERSKRDKVVVLQNVFDRESFDRDPGLILECSKNLRERCAPFGKVTKVVVHDKNAEGTCQVFFSSAEEADLAISMLDGRLYGAAGSAGSRVLKAFTWDGKTKYKVEETEEEERERLKKWDEFLDEEDEGGEKAELA